MLLWMLVVALLAATTNFFIIPGLLRYNSAEKTDELDTLVLLHVLFRHGDRSPDQSEIYPNDLHSEKGFDSIGYGQLTKEGRQREYMIGKWLRERYDQFLGLYGPDVVVAKSTDYVRTRMSCLLVLAGLYPPAPEQIWENSIFWQPIPYDYEPRKQDRILGDPLKYCKPFNTLYNDFLLSSKGKSFYEKNKDIYDYVSKSTGWNIKTPSRFYDLYFVLKSEETMGLKLPDWTKNVWPTNVTTFATDEYRVHTATPRMLRIAAGYLLKKLLDETELKLTNQSPQQRKIYLYSAHENNIAYILIALGVFEPHVPPFGAYVVLEVHNIQGVYGIKFLYQDYQLSSSEPKVLKLPDCDVLCPIDRFKIIVENILPLESDCDSEEQTN